MIHAVFADETLAEHIKKKYKNKEVVLNLEVVLKILSQLLECLAHMEKEKVTHGDITCKSSQPLCMCSQLLYVELFHKK